ncbi:MAG: hypothetical protein JHC74_00770 [Thermoleophilia bacterium]|nr:hypothetical protein [Thermoleophilia bacterium]
MPSRPPRAIVLLVVAAAVAVVAGCSDEVSNGCNCCCTPAIDPTAQAVWVAQGTRLTRLDPATGAIAWTRQVTRRTPSGLEELTDVSAAPQGVWVAWGSGAALVPGRSARTVRVSWGPRGSHPTLATASGRTWVATGRRVIALRPDGTTGRVVRFPSAVRVEAAPGAIVVSGRGAPVLLDPRTGEQLSAAVISRNPGWRAEPREDRIVRVDPLDGRVLGEPLRVEELAAVVETPAGAAYATASNNHLAVVRLGADGPRIAWRTSIRPG